MSVNSKMTAIADEVRTLSGTAAAMGLDAMAGHVRDANGKVEVQAGLIAQIAAALQGKAGASGGSAEIETWTGIVCGASGLGELPDIYYVYIDPAGNICEEILSAGQEKSIVIPAHGLVLTCRMSTSWTQDSDNGVLTCIDSEIVYKPTRDNFVIR